MDPVPAGSGSVGHRVFARPADLEHEAGMRALRTFDLSNIADAMHGTGCMDAAIRLLTGQTNQVAGPALTVTISPGNGMMIRKAITVCEAGDVIVVNGWGNTDRAVLGGSVAADMVARGVAGLVVDGMVRDLDELRALGLPVFARGLIARSGSDLRGFGEVFAPVACGMVPVMPGDLVVGSIDGVVVVPRADLAWVVEQARGVQQRKGSKGDVESRLRDAREGTLRFSHEAVQRALDESGCVEFAFPWEPDHRVN